MDRIAARPKVRDAMRAVEWVDSGDYADGDENAVIEKAFEFARGAREVEK